MEKNNYLKINYTRMCVYVCVCACINMHMNAEAVARKKPFPATAARKAFPSRGTASFIYFKKKIE